MTIRARLKAVADIDPALLYCEGQAESLRAHEGEILELLPGIHSEQVICSACGSIQTISFMLLEDGRRAVTGFYPLDEGIEAGS